MLNYIINSIRRKIARRITRQYPTSIREFYIPEIGKFHFANWDNPLVSPKKITENQIRFFGKFLKKGDVAVDIGANIGATTLPMSFVVGKEGAVIAFDPNPFVFKVLAQNVNLNPGLCNIRAFNYAITDSEGEFYYNSSEASFNNGGISSSKTNRHGNYSLDHKVRGVQLSHFLNTLDPGFLPKLKLVKIDTEGYDKEIIKSISEILKVYKPVVISECFGKSEIHDRHEHFKLLHDLGYSLFYFSDFDHEAEIIPIQTMEAMMNWKHFDFYAIPKSGD